MSDEKDRYIDLSPATRTTLVRMLATIARADGFLDPLETDLLELFGGKPLAENRRGLISFPSPTAHEMANIPASSRETVYWLCALMVCTDHDVDETESRLLETYGTKLGLSPSQCQDLLAKAQTEIVERACRKAASQRTRRDERLRSLSIVASNLGVPEAQLETLRRRYDLASPGEWPGAARE